MWDLLITDTADGNAIAVRGDHIAYVADHDLRTYVGQQVGTGDRAVAHPADDLGVQLGDRDLGDLRRCQESAERVAEPEATDQDFARAEVEDRTREGLL